MSTESSITPPEEGGIGGRTITNPRLAKSEMVMNRMALRRKWKIDPAWLDEAPAEAAAMMRTSNDDRTKIRAMEYLRACHKDNQEAEIALDKLERLDAGEATENVAQRVVVIVE